MEITGVPHRVSRDLAVLAGVHADTDRDVRARAGHRGEPLNGVVRDLAVLDLLIVYIDSDSVRRTTGITNGVPVDHVVVGVSYNADACKPMVCNISSVSSSAGHGVTVNRVIVTTVYQDPVLRDRIDSVVPDLVVILSADVYPNTTGLDVLDGVTDDLLIASAKVYPIAAAGNGVDRIVGDLTVGCSEVTLWISLLSAVTFVAPTGTFIP